VNAAMAALSRRRSVGAAASLATAVEALPAVVVIWGQAHSEQYITKS